MTRDEAIAKGAAVELLGKGAPTSYTNKVFASNVVAVLEAIGMLKLDEPKSVNDIARETIEREVMEWNMIRSGSVKASNVSGSMLMAFNRAGLKIVEK